MRYALDILSILTVVPKTQLLLSEAVAVLDEGGSTVSTVGRCCYESMMLLKCFVLYMKQAKPIVTQHIGLTPSGHLVDNQGFVFGVVLHFPVRVYFTTMAH